MSQGSTVLPTTGVFSGVQEQDFINAAEATLLSLSSGGSAPTSPTALQLWADTSTPGQATVRQYNGSVWVPIWTLSLTSGLPPAFSTAPTQRSIRTSADLPITASDQIVNISATTDLTPVLPSYATRNGIALEIKLVPGCHAQTLTFTGLETADGVTSVGLVAGQDVIFRPYTDNVNTGYGIA